MVIHLLWDRWLKAANFKKESVKIEMHIWYICTCVNACTCIEAFDAETTKCSMSPLPVIVFSPSGINVRVLRSVPKFNKTLRRPLCRSDSTQHCSIIPITQGVRVENDRLVMTWVWEHIHTHTHASCSFPFLLFSSNLSSAPPVCLVSH